MDKSLESSIRLAVREGLDLDSLIHLVKSVAVSEAMVRVSNKGVVMFSWFKKFFKLTQPKVLTYTLVQISEAGLRPTC